MCAVCVLFELVIMLAVEGLKQEEEGEEAGKDGCFALSPTTDLVPTDTPLLQLETVWLVTDDKTLFSSFEDLLF